MRRLIVDLKVIYQRKGLQGLDECLGACAHLVNSQSEAAEGGSARFLPMYRPGMLERTIGRKIVLERTVE